MTATSAQTDSSARDLLELSDGGRDQIMCATGVTSEDIRGVITTERLAIIAQRLADGFYERDSIRLVIARRVLDDLAAQGKPLFQRRHDTQTNL